MPDISDFYIYLFMVYAVAIVVVVLYVVLRHRGKMRVFVKDPLGDKLEWHKPHTDEKGNYIRMRKPSKKGDFGWEFHFDNRHLQYGHGRFRKYQYIEIFPEAPEAIAFDFEGKQIEQPHWDKKTSAAFIDRRILERRGEEPKEGGTPAIFYIILLMVGINIVLTFIFSGKVEFH